MSAPRSIEGLTALVTGGNRGLGAGFVEVLLDRGAQRVYCAARDPASAQPLVDRFGDRVVPYRLDVIDVDRVEAAGRELTDVDLLISNAGLTYIKPLLETNLDHARLVMETNYFGPLNLIYAFAETLKRRGGGLISILSLAALMPGRVAPLYGATKAAGHMLGAAARAALAPEALVSMSYPGPIDTDMDKGFERAKSTPQEIARRTLDGWAEGRLMIFPDLNSELIRDALLTEMADIMEDPLAVMLRIGQRYREQTTPDQLFGA